MHKFNVRGQEYALDGAGFLQNREQWDEAFADALAPHLGIPGGLAEEHWRVVRTIRDWFLESSRCPVLFETCRQTDLGLRRMSALFPTGYLRGACKLAGLTHFDVYLCDHRPASGPRPPTSGQAAPPSLDAETEVTLEKVYPTDVLGFLVAAEDWDELWAALRAREIGVPGGLSKRHWAVLRWMRGHHAEHGVVPTVYQTSEAMKVDLEEFERLFPQGYGRVAVKLAGLNVRT